MVVITRMGGHACGFPDQGLPRSGLGERLFGVSVVEPPEVQLDPVAVDDDYDARGIGASSGQVA